VTFALARSLLLADAVTPAALAEALFLSATRGTSLVRTLLAARAIDTLRLEQVLERGEAPYMRHIAPVTALVERLPPGLCDRLLAIPVRSDARTGTVDVAVVDARDPHPAEELGYWLKAPVRVVRTSIATMEAALLRLVARVEPEPEPELGMRSLAPPIWAPPAPIPAAFLRTPMYGSKAFDAAAAALESGEDPDIAIPLTRRNITGQPIVQIGGDVGVERVELGAPAIEKSGNRWSAPPRDARVDAGPVLELNRRKALLPAGTSVPPAPASSLGDVLERMLRTQDRDEILELLVAGMHPLARRACVLAVRRDGLAGWTASRDFAERSALRAVRLSNAVRTVFHEAFDRSGPAVTRVPADVAHAPLVAVLRPPPTGAVVVAAVTAEGRPAAVVFADGIGDATAALERIGVLARTAGEALGRLLRERRGEKSA
jgi:hypothetical protein